MNKTKNLIPTILSILALASVCATPFIVLIYEKEVVEAVFGGIIMGSIIGSVFGISAIICNKERGKLVYILSAVPILILTIFLVMYIPYSLYK